MSKKTVLVLGAGFTKSFASNSPTLKTTPEQIGVPELLKKYDGFENIKNILNGLITHDGLINVEETLTRLSVGMPFDSVVLSEGERRVLLNDIKETYFSLIKEIKIDQKNLDVIKSLSKHIIDRNISVVTFNYDTLIDEYLWKVKGYRNIPGPGENYFHPDGGYGFFCKPSTSIVSNPDVLKDHCESSVYKLHGSLNWRIKIGSSQPYTVDAIVHDEDWLPVDSPVSEDEKETHLEKSPFIVPPILDKSEINNQSILKVVWAAAFKKLREADEITFIGYSLPKTDIAAKFLFREAMSGRNPEVKVVNSSKNNDEIKRAYKEIYPEILDNQFISDDAATWVSKNCI